MRLLRSLGVVVDAPRGQSCCGQPAWNAGHLGPARRMAEHTAAVFETSEHVVLPSGSCAAMMKCHYGALIGDGGAKLGERIHELAEFVVRVLGVTELGRGLAGLRVAYHHGCHALRELGVAEEPLLLLRNAGAELVRWEADRECCGFGGLFAVKEPAVSVAMADRKLDTLPAVDALVSADSGCLLHLDGRLRRRGLDVPVRSLASLLWEARKGSGADSGDVGPEDGDGREGPEVAGGRA